MVSRSNYDMIKDMSLAKKIWNRRIIRRKKNKTYKLAGEEVNLQFLRLLSYSNHLYVRECSHT